MRACAAIARAALALVVSTAENGSDPKSAATGSIRNSGASITTWPRARRTAAVRSPSSRGRVTSRRTQSPRNEEVGRREAFQLAPGFAAERRCIVARSGARGLMGFAAVRPQDQAAELQRLRRDLRMPGDRRAARAVE